MAIGTAAALAATSAATTAAATGGTAAAGLGGTAAAGGAVGGGYAATQLFTVPSAINAMGQGASYTLAGGLSAGAGGGAMGLYNAANMAGMGLAAYQAFSGGSKQGMMPSQKIPLSDAMKSVNKAMEKSFEDDWQNAQAGIIDPNLARIGIRKIVRNAMLASQQARSTVRAGAARASSGRDLEGRSSGVLSGRHAAAAMLGLQQDAQAGAAPDLWKAMTRSENFRNSLKQQANLRNLDMHAPILSARSRMAEAGFDAMSGATRGQALGDIAQMAGMMYFMNNTRRS